MERRSAVYSPLSRPAGNPDPYIPDFRYFLLDEGRFDKKLLSKLKEAVASFIRLDSIDRLALPDLTAKKSSVSSKS